uniref:Integrator complex subunit 11 n=1 Tax=Angiostrongylus cantonensis TaxID=6313 RepID=A0A158PA49_ANGCA
MTDIKIVPLGAGQDVGRSCILVTIGGKNVMLDCGMHMGYQDERRFPDFSYISGGGKLNDYLSCVIISHFHLDHCGSLPHMSEIVGYDGPIYMTYPTKAIAPVLLEDYRKVQTEFRGDTSFFTSANIKASMKKVVAIDLHETVQVDNELSIRAFYAGHVLGAAMFEIRVGHQSILYTGDYNMTPDRHLGAARVLPGLRPNCLISESTYATTIRDSKRARERDFLRKVHDRVMAGGKVLIPVFALGRAQELCILLESYWERMDLKVPIYFSQGLAERANQYYRLFINWTNEKIKRTFVERNMFDFKHIKPLEKGYEEMPGAMVLFSTPGMLHGGQSLKVFRKWCHDPRNIIIMPGYCVAGTVGAKVISGMKKIEIEGKMHDINLGVEYMSFSAHADAKGIMQLIRDCQPRSVMFVHGEAAKMEFLKGKVEKEFRVPVLMPANGECVVIPGTPSLEVDVPLDIVQRSIELDPTPSKKACPFSACLIMDKQVSLVFLSIVSAVGRCRSLDGRKGISRLSGLEVISCEAAASKLQLGLHTITLSQLVKSRSTVDWRALSEALSIHDTNLQQKQVKLIANCSLFLLSGRISKNSFDGIELFHGEICVLPVKGDENQVELIWDECREAWQSTILQTIQEIFSKQAVTSN